MADVSSEESCVEDNVVHRKRKLSSTKTRHTEEKERWHDMSPEEEDLIGRLHRLLGDRWELISGRLPNKTAEEVKKYWTTKERKEFMKTKFFRPICVRAHPRPIPGTAESIKQKTT